MGPVLSQITHRIYILGMNHLSGGDQVSQNLLKENTEERTLKQGESLEKKTNKEGDSMLRRGFQVELRA